MAIRKFVKDPNAVLDYTLSWDAWLVDGDTITTCTATATTGITVQSVSNTTTDSTVWLAGGTSGQSYDVTMRVTTNGGRIDERTITITCKEQ